MFVIPNLTTLVVVVTAILGFFGEFLAFRREINTQKKEFKSALADNERHTQQILLEIKKDERDFQLDIRKDEREFQQQRYNLSLEERRSGEVNIEIKRQLRIANAGAPAQEHFAVFEAELINHGEGPIDLLAAITAGRLLSPSFRPGIGLHSREVTWDDYESFPWFTNDPDALFAGLSTSKTMIAASNHFLRLAPDEVGPLRRIDAFNHTNVVAPEKHTYLMYRLFTVARGYPVGEVLRQLGGGPPDPVSNVDQNQLQFRALARANYRIWRDIQSALMNLSRFAFRMALGTNDRFGADPLGLIATNDGWRFFLLFYRNFYFDFTLPDGSKTTFEKFAQAVWDQFLPQRLITTELFQPNNPLYERIHQYCATQLASVIAKWREYCDVVEACDTYMLRGDSYNGIDFPRVKPVREFVHEGYPERIHTDANLRDAWINLLRDGYLVSRPFPRNPKENGEVNLLLDYNEYDIPDDPRVLEPFIIRTHYFLEDLDAGESSWRPNGESGF